MIIAHRKGLPQSLYCVKVFFVRRNKSKGPEVRYIEWTDSCTILGWQPPEEKGVSHITSIGLFVSENSEEVILSASRSEHGRVLDQVAIPRSAIRTMRKVKL
jgi:hypothetical protein